MAPVENHDLEQTVIVVTHPRAKRVGGPQSHVTVLTNALALEPPNRAQDAPEVPRNPVEPRIWLLDQHPHIHAGMSRRELRPDIDWQIFQRDQTSDWKCWKFIQNWRVFTHGVIRMKFMRRQWHHLGDLLKTLGGTPRRTNASPDG